MTDSYGSTLYKLTWKRVAMPSGRWCYLLRARERRTDDTAYSSWPTPNAGPQNDTDTTWEDRREALKAQHKNGNGFGLTLGMATSLVCWPTPIRADGERANLTHHHGENNLSLRGAASLEEAQAKMRAKGAGVANLNEQAKQTGFGVVMSSSGVVTRVEVPSGAMLNPAHSRWLMGLPAAWDDCAPTATRSSSRSRRNS